MFRFVNERDLENHINAKHQPKTCPLCDESFETKLDLINHINNSMDADIPTVQHFKCNHCNKSFNRTKFNKHKQNSSCRPNIRNITCKKCNAICISQDGGGLTYQLSTAYLSDKWWNIGPVTSSGRDTWLNTSHIL